MSCEKLDPRVEVLTELRKQTALLERMIALHESYMLTEAAVSARPAQSAVSLTGPHGDPIIKAKDPRDWSGDPMTGKHFSECPPEYLDLLAERYDYFASKNDDEAATAKRVNDAPVVAEMEKKARYAKLDASRARAWAAKLRAGYVPTSTGTPAVSEAGREPTW